MTSLSKYKKLTEIEHVIKRPGIYLGAVEEREEIRFSAGSVYDKKQRYQKEALTYSPGLLKLFDEVITNSVDENIRNKNVTEIRVSYSTLTGEIVIQDNGGIPVKKHPEYDQWIPSMIFSELRTGSNFDDEDRSTGGTNGLGAKLTVIFSKSFHVETSDGENVFVQLMDDNMSTIRPPHVFEKPDARPKGTTITFTPDYELLGTSPSIENLKVMLARTIDIAGCNPKIRVFFNNERIRFKTFADYSTMFFPAGVADKQNDWELVIGPTDDDTFSQKTYVNGVDTYNGGTHVDYVTGKIVTELRRKIKQKYKVDVKPNNIKQQMMLVMKCTINAPSFSSQSKETLTTDPKTYGSEYTPSATFISKLMDSPVVANVIAWAEGERRRQEEREFEKLNKQTNNTSYLKRILKFDDASSTNRANCSLLLTEGDTAAKPILLVRDPRTQGVFPLRGKPINVRDVKTKKLLENEEFANIMAILGLKVGMPATDIRFGRIIVASDADADGSHIIGLLINMFNYFWPELIGNGHLFYLRTPIIIAKTSKGSIDFFEKDDYLKWKTKGIKHSYKHYKGLGTFTDGELERFINDPSCYVPLTRQDAEDTGAIDLVFDKDRADDRKDWLTIGVKDV